MYFLGKEIGWGVFVMKTKRCLGKYTNTVMLASLIMLVGSMGSVMGMDGEEGKPAENVKGVPCGGKIRDLKATLAQAGLNQSFPLRLPNPSAAPPLKKGNSTTTFSSTSRSNHHSSPSLADSLSSSSPKSTTTPRSINRLSSPPLTDSSSNSSQKSQPSPIRLSTSQPTQPTTMRSGVSQASEALSPRAQQDALLWSNNSPDLILPSGALISSAGEELFRYANGVFLIHKTFDSIEEGEKKTFREMVRGATHVQIDPSIASKVTDSDIEKLPELCPHLNFYNLSNCSRLTDDGLSRLALCGQLIEMDLSGCSSVTENGLVFARDLTAHALKLKRYTPPEELGCQPIQYTASRGINGVLVSSSTKTKLFRYTDGVFLILKTFDSMSKGDLKGFGEMVRGATHIRVDPLIAGEFRDSDMRRLTSFCSHLEVCELNNCIKLTHKSINDLIFHRPSVRRIELQNCSGMGNVNRRPDLEIVGQQPEYVGSTSITNSRNFPGAPGSRASIVPTVPPSCDTPEYPRIADSCGFVFSKSHSSDDIYEWILKLPTNAKTLELNCKNLDDNTVWHLGNQEKLCELDLSRCIGITDRAVTILASRNNLKFLKLINCSKITDRGLRELPSMRKLIRLELEIGKAITSGGLFFLKELKELEELHFWSEEDPSDTVSADVIATLAVNLPKLYSIKLSRHGLNSSQKTYDSNEIQSIRDRPRTWLDFQNGYGLGLSIAPSLDTNTGNCDLTELIEKGILEKSNKFTKGLGFTGYLLKKLPSAMVSSHDCDDLFARQGEHLKALAFDKSIQSKVSNEDVKLLLAACPNLSVLDLSECKQIGEKSFIESLGYSVSQGKLKGLLWLNLNGCESLNDNGLRCIIANLKTLKVLTLVGCEGISGQGLSGVENGKLDLAAMKSLAVLDLSYCPRITSLPKSLPSSLEWLALIDCKKMTKDHLRSLKELSRLKSLDLSGCEKVESLVIQSLSKLPNLKKLDLSGCEEICDNDLLKLWSFGGLEALGLRGCPNISIEEVPPLLRKLSGLKRFSFDVNDFYKETGIEHIRRNSLDWTTAEERNGKTAITRKARFALQSTKERQVMLSILSIATKAVIALGFMPSGVAEAPDRLIAAADALSGYLDSQTQ